MEKEYLRLITEQVRKARNEAIGWANHDTKAIVVKYQGSNDKEQLLEAELLKAKEYKDSNVGHAYINSLAPDFDDEELVVSIANYYASHEVFGTVNSRTGWTVESIQEFAYKDSLVFFRRYYLALNLSRLIKSITKKMEPPRKRTKEKEVFSDIVTHPQKEWFIGRLHQLIGDKPGGARVGKILIKAVLDGNLMRFPTQEEFKGEFGLMGTWGAIYNKFHDKDKVMNNAKLYDELDNIVF